jgi:hypothetical protein
VLIIGLLVAFIPAFLMKFSYLYFLMFAVSIGLAKIVIERGLDIYWGLEDKYDK